MALAENRRAVARDLRSLLSLLDAGAKAKVAADLIFDLWMSASPHWARQAREHGRAVEPEEDAALAILFIMRAAAASYCKIAEQGNAALAGELPTYATKLVECLNRIARSHPELVRRVAGEQATWPIMAAKSYPKPSDFAKLADRIGLAKDCTVSPHKAQKWKPDTPINVFLLDLFGGLVITEKDCYWRSAAANWPKLTPRTVSLWLDEIIMPSLDHIREKEGSWQGIKVLAEMLEKVPYEAEHRRHVRNRIKAALRGMARGVKD
jgi:hypothetical protein